MVTYSWSREVTQRTEEDRVNEHPEDDTESIVDKKNEGYWEQVTMGVNVAREKPYS